MADFINTIDSLGDDAVFDSIINRTIAEFKDDKVTVLRQRAFSGCTSLRSVNLPNVRYYYSHAFSGCTALTDVSLPELVDYAEGSYAQGLFFGCTLLQTVSLPKLTKAYNSMFFDCSNLINISIPAATSLGTNVAENCKALKVADFPAVTGIGARAFFGCSALTALVLRETDSVCNLNNANAFTGTPIADGTGYIYVPSELYDLYVTASGWSTYANQFRKLEEWTVDGTVTGALDIENRHMVRFFNDDGTLLGYKVVTTGSDATYDGTPVCSEGASWEFEGFEPVPTNVTADMDCYAKYIEPIKFETATWAEIAEIVSSGAVADFFALGDTRTVPFTYEDGTTEDVTFEIVDLDSSNIVSGTTLAIMATHALKNPVEFNAQKSSDLYYAYSSMLTYMKDTLTPCLPEDMQAAIQRVQMPHASAYSKMHIPTSQQICGYAYTYETPTVIESSILEAFINGKSKICKTADGTAVEWWTATTAKQSTTSKLVPTYFSTSGTLTALQNYGGVKKYVRPICFI